MSSLRVTRAKARTLLYDSDIRAIPAEKLDDHLRLELARALFTKDGDYFVVEIENPLLRAHLRGHLQRMRHVSDTSFNQSLVRMSLDAVGDLAENILDDDRRGKVKDALVEAGAPDTSFKGVVVSGLKRLGSKVAGEAGDQAAEEIVGAASGFLKPLFDGVSEEIVAVWKGVFADDEPETIEGA